MNSASDISSMFGQSQTQNQPTEQSRELLELRAKSNALRVASFNNAAMVHLKRGEFEKVHENCSKALKSAPYNFDYKALLRRGRAFRQCMPMEMMAAT